MRYYRQAGDDGPRLLAVADQGDDADARDLTAVKPRLRTFRDLAAAADVADEGVDDIATNLAAEAPRVDAPADGDTALPLIPEEVWAAGVTYEISEQAREEESGMADVYLDVYDGERPEIFFKATPSRTVGPGEAVGVRGDSDWNVPEPELGLVLYDGEIVGYTVGNDVSSRAIEGENPLYLPQAKVYDRCCALGPCVVGAGGVEDPHNLAMSMRIDRDGETVYDDVTSTAEMARTCEELADYWQAHNAVPELGVLLTGTSLVPEGEFTLRPGDEVTIEIEEIGELRNSVVEV
ncbi:fumarylacetoacetate hydrolase family protein [Halolamina salifodinae]|uniref:2-dehydro-3-deoxy-D-arabinonate dehydratase n=1 Tax=Halolamina salifodinae TaxID=1202767 RepID=A0A8T4GWL6_9EURY|nr:fumarylacetoacetate hydrolase family protein [Halolamina salifodinae]MBP1986850.1 2-dehydro-3-deoxy-D-arabinonate dehydratase [Halolamina salifodinae]